MCGKRGRQTMRVYLECAAVCCKTSLSVPARLRTKFVPSAACRPQGLGCGPTSGSRPQLCKECMQECPLTGGACTGERA
eukprot:166629-Chlamydomonas_euryale.AAC.5